MKGKLILIFCGLVSASVMASETNYANLISHQEWSDANIKLNSNSTKLDQFNISKFISQTKESRVSGELITDLAKVWDVKVNPSGSSSVIDVINQIYIKNSLLTQAYTITRSACAINTHGNGSQVCSYTKDTVSVDGKPYESNGSFTANWTPTEAGKYIVVFGASIQNNSNVTVFESYDYRNITVPAAS